MENGLFGQKISRQHNVVIKQLSKFRKVWQDKTITPDRLQTYCTSVTYISQLHSTYVHNCMQYFTPLMKQQMMQVNSQIIENLVRKIRYFSTARKGNELQNGRQKKQVCQLCQSKMREVDVKIMKEQLSDDAYLRKTLLKKIYADIREDDGELFTKDEDEVFFKFLNRILVKKEEVLAMQTKEINSFLVEVTKSFSDLNFLTVYTPISLKSTDFQENYKQQLSKKITVSLSKAFQSKVHPWMQKVFEQIKQNITKQLRPECSDKGFQAGEQLELERKRLEYINASESKREIDKLKEEIGENILTIDELKSKLIVVERQKKQLQEYYTKEIEDLMINKREVEIKLRKTETDLNNLKQVNDDEVAQLNRKLKHEMKKTQQIDKTKSQIQEPQNNQKPIETVNNNQLTSRKKKKSPVNHLLSNKSLKNKQLSTTSNNITTKQDRNENINVQVSMKKTTSQFIPLDIEKINKDIDFIEESKKTKKSIKKVVRSLKNGKEQLSRVKVEFKLEETLTKPTENKANMADEKIQASNNQDNINQLSSTSKISKKTSSEIKNSQSSIVQTVKQKKIRNMRRGLSIQMSISPINKTVREAIQKQQSLQHNNTIEQESESFLIENPNNNVNNPPKDSRKKVFEFVPLQSQQEYEQLKEKISEVTSRIQYRTSQKLKASMKIIHNADVPNREVGRVYGCSIFSKKCKEKSGVDDSMRRKENQDSQQGKHNEGIRTCDRQIQTSFKDLQGVQTSSIFQQIPVQQRQSLLSQLKQQLIVPKTFTFHQYQLLIRKLFTQSQQLSVQLQSPKPSYHTRNQSLNNKNVKLLQNFKQTESSKINIDAKFLDEVRFVNKSNSNSRVILNLPKLNQLTHQRISVNNISKGSLLSSTMREQSILCRQTVNNLTDLKISPENNKENSTTNVSPTKDLQNITCSIKPTTKSLRSNELFTQKDLKIFFQTELAAYEYEKTFKGNFQKENNQSKYTYKPTSQQKQLISSLYSMLMQVKSKNHQAYYKIISFLKYPYSTVRHGFDFVNIGKDISFQLFNQYLNRIYTQRILNEQKITFIHSLEPFEEKLAQLLLLENK